MALRPTIVASLLVVPALIVAGCGGSSSSAEPGAASVVPASASAFIAFDTDQSSSQWKAADALTRRFPDRQRAIASIEKDLKQGSGIDYKTDVEPTLGDEISIAWLDFAGGGQDVVVLVQPKDEAAFKRLVSKGNAKDPTSKVVYEKVGDWDALADKQSVLDKFSAESKAGGAMLADDPSFKGALKAIPSDSLLKAYVSGAKVMDEIRKRGGASVDKTLQKIGTLDWVVAAVGATSDGVRFDTIVRGTPGTIFQGKGVDTRFHASLPDSVPGDALLYFAFHGSEHMFDGLAKTPQLATARLRPLVKLLQGLGTLLQGENGVYLRNPPAGSKIPEVTLVADPGNGVDGVSTLSRLLAEKPLDLGKKLRLASIAGLSATTVDFGPFALDYAIVSNKLVVTDGPGGIKAFANPSSTLGTNQDFSGAANQSGLPSKAQGFLYVNVTGGLALGQRLASARIPASIKRDLSPLRSAIAYGVTRPSEIQVTFFLRIK